MGMFDRILIPCKCGEQIEFQSKGGKCVLADYTIESAPMEVLIGADRHGAVQSCEYCNACVQIFPLSRTYAFTYDGDGGELGKALDALDEGLCAFPCVDERMTVTQYERVMAVARAWRKKKERR